MSSGEAREPVSCKETFTSIVAIELLPLIGGAVIAAIGYNQYFKQSAGAPGMLLLVVGLALVVRGGVVINFMRLSGFRGTCGPCCFRLDGDRFWRHPAGFEVPVVQCVFPGVESSRPVRGGAEIGGDGA